MSKPLIFDKRVEFKMPKEKYDELTDAAEEKGLTVSEYIRQSISLK